MALLLCQNKTAKAEQGHTYAGHIQRPDGNDGGLVLGYLWWKERKAV